MTHINHQNSAHIAIVDDDPGVLETLSLVLQEFGFSHLQCFPSAEAALENFEVDKFEVVITDLTMPGMDGFELLRQLRKQDSDLPVIILTGNADMNRAVEAFRHGAFDLITKPFQPLQIVKDLNRALSTRRLSRLEKEYKIQLEQRVWERTSDYRSSLAKMTAMNREMIRRLGIAAEHRDDDTGTHIARIAFYVHRFARILGLGEEKADQLALASTMHDIGKIGIPDSILFKAAALTREEFAVIKTHTEIGEKILSDSSFEVLEIAAVIAATHHEKWDGSGYPRGLQGEEIPMSGRITMIADHYDALRSRRPYKLPFSHEQACDIIINGDGRTIPAHFDPDLHDAFSRHADEFKRIFDDNQIMGQGKFRQAFFLQEKKIEYSNLACT